MKYLASIVVLGLLVTDGNAAIPLGGVRGDEATSIWYDAGTGELGVDPPAGTELTSINITSEKGWFIGDKPAVAKTNISKTTPERCLENIMGIKVIKGTIEYYIAYISQSTDGISPTEIRRGCIAFAPLPTSRRHSGRAHISNQSHFLLRRFTRMSLT